MVSAWPPTWSLMVMVNVCCVMVLLSSELAFDFGESFAGEGEHGRASAASASLAGLLLERLRNGQQGSKCVEQRWGGFDQLCIV